MRSCFCPFPSRVEILASGARSRQAKPSRSDAWRAADFDDIDGYLAYRDHPEHRAMISQFILPVAAQRIAVQYEF
jgi:hypothetical protein